MSFKILITALSTIFLSLPVWGWGERGHHLIGYTAAKLVYKSSDPAAKKHGVNRFFFDRAIAFGHLANVPDISWKDKPRNITKAGFATHFMDPEILLGQPQNNDEFHQKIRQLPANYNELKKKYAGQASPLKAYAQKTPKTDIFGSVGTSPWRAQQLFDLMVKAFKCAGGKQKAKSRSSTATVILSANRPVFDAFTCNKNLDRKQALLAAVMFGGTLGHFIGDQAQPYHSTVDYDGWHTGNGGIHSYFEGAVVSHMGEDLPAKVSAMANDKKFQQRLWKKLETPLEAENGVAKFMLHLMADSFQKLSAVRGADTKYAVTQKSKSLALGEQPGSGKKLKKTRRRSPSHPEVQKAFEPIVVERLAIGAYALHRVWLAAWKKAGQPNLRDIGPIDLSYPLDVPFVWPDYDKSALGKK